MELRPIDRLVQPLQIFFGYRVSGAILLLGAAVIAVVWANSPWAETYHHLLELPVSVGFGDFVLEKHLLHWVNDGLMGIFFFHVGLEIKREVRDGQLSTRRGAALPMLAAVGGMVVPAGLYLALNAGLPGEPGWGVPMATDIAFALGVLALLGDRVPPSLRIFLTALAIVDDIGAVIVIAVFYTAGLSFVSLGVGLAAYVVAVALNRLHVRSALVYLMIGIVVWLAFLQSGVHATVAALLMAFTVPGRTQIDGDRLLARLSERTQELRQAGVPLDSRTNTPEQQHLLDDMSIDIGRASSPLLRLEHAMAPLVAFVVLPIFALANAGVTLGGGLVESALDPIALGVALGLVVGKPLGITIFSWLAVRLGMADLPPDVRWPHVAAVGALGGIGFTMALFIAGLAFGPEGLETAKLGILAASLVSGLAGGLALRALLTSRPPPRSADSPPASPSR